MHWPVGFVARGRPPPPRVMRYGQGMTTVCDEAWSSRLAGISRSLCDWTLTMLEHLTGGRGGLIGWLVACLTLRPSVPCELNCLGVGVPSGVRCCPLVFSISRSIHHCWPVVVIVTASSRWT